MAFLKPAPGDLAACGAWWRMLWLASVVLVSPSILDSANPPALAKEYEIKAVFLYNFAQFVDWPADAFTDKSAPLVIGILGRDPFGPYMDDVVRGETVNGRPFEVRRFARAEDVAGCHILFISSSESGQLDEILDRLKGKSVLTVGDMDGFSQFGGMIRFVTENNKVRLRINVTAAKSAGLKISSKLLRPAQIVSRLRN
jgi:YfiR/HmsC-like